MSKAVFCEHCFVNHAKRKWLECQRDHSNVEVKILDIKRRRITIPDQPIDGDDQLPPVCEPVEYELEPADFQSMSPSVLEHESIFLDVDIDVKIDNTHVSDLQVLPLQCTMYTHIVSQLAPVEICLHSFPRTHQYSLLSLRIDSRVSWDYAISQFKSMRLALHVRLSMT